MVVGRVWTCTCHKVPQVTNGGKLHDVTAASCSKLAVLRRAENTSALSRKGYLKGQASRIGRWFCKARQRRSDKMVLSRCPSRGQRTQVPAIRSISRLPVVLVRIVSSCSQELSPVVLSGFCVAIEAWSTSRSPSLWQTAPLEVLISGPFMAR